MFGIIQFHAFLLVAWWWIQYRYWKYEMKFRDDIVPVGLNDENTLYNLFNTGDIILNRGEMHVWNHPMYYYALYCSISRTIFTHVGVIVKDHIKKKLYILHVAPKFTGIRDFLGSHPQPHAFILHDLRHYIQQYKGSTLIRRRKRDSLIFTENFKAESETLTNIAHEMYNEYRTGGYRFARLGTIISRYVDMYTDDEHKHSREVHCAEFAGLLLQKMGLLDPNIKSWNVYPDSFSIEKNRELPGYEEVYFYIKQDLNFKSIKNKAVSWYKTKKMNLKLPKKTNHIML
jgi:hypothetical protein